MKKSKYYIDKKRLACRCRNIGFPAEGGDLIWWLDGGGISQWQMLDGRKLHSDLTTLDMTVRWRGRMNRNGNTTVQPPASMFARFDAEDLLSRLPEDAMMVLGMFETKRFYLDTRTGLIPLRMRNKARLADRKLHVTIDGKVVRWKG